MNMSLRTRLHWSRSYLERASSCFNALWRSQHISRPDSRIAVDLRDTAYTLADVAAMLARPV